MTNRPPSTHTPVAFTTTTAAIDGLLALIDTEGAGVPEENRAALEEQVGRLLARIGTPVPVGESGPWVRLGALRPGAVFETRDGVRAVKSDYTYPTGGCECVLLASGDAAHFHPIHDATEVREIEVGATHDGAVRA